MTMLLAPPSQDLPEPPMGGYYPGLRLMGSLYWDAQKQRIAASNRIDSPDVDSKAKERLGDFVAGLRATEDEARKLLVREFKACAPHLAAWAESVPGVGVPSLARLIGEIGSPAIAYPYVWETDEEGKRLESPTPLPPYWRTLGQLRSYCGYGDPTRKRSKGMTAEDALALGNPGAKTILHLIVEACVKVNKGPVREAYDNARVRYRPAQESGEITAAHAMARAYRFAAKEVLYMLWRVDRERYGIPTDDRPVAG